MKRPEDRRARRRNGATKRALNETMNHIVPRALHSTIQRAVVRRLIAESIDKSICGGGGGSAYRRYALVASWCQPTAQDGLLYSQYSLLSPHRTSVMLGTSKHLSLPLDRYWMRKPFASPPSGATRSIPKTICVEDLSSAQSCSALAFRRWIGRVHRGDAHFA